MRHLHQIYKTCLFSVVSILVVVLSFCSNVSADCLGDQLACNNNCLASRYGDVACVARCGERAQACVQQQFNKSHDGTDDSPYQQRGRSLSRDEADDDYTPSSRQSRQDGGNNASSQYWQGGDYNHCLRTSNGNDYFWVNVQNLCSESIHIQFTAQNNSSSKCDGAKTLRSGAKDSLGFSRGYVNDCGGISFAVCPDGYKAVDGNDTWWGYRSGRSYSCKSPFMSALEDTRRRLPFDQWKEFVKKKPGCATVAFLSRAGPLYSLGPSQTARLSR